MATIGDRWYAVAPLPRLDARLFVGGRGRIGPAHDITSKLDPGEYLWAPELGPWTALVLGDPNATAASLGVFDSGVAGGRTRRLVDEMLELGASLSTLRFAAVGSARNLTLPHLWRVLDRRLGPEPLPQPGRLRFAPGPANVFAGDRVYVVCNGVGSWLGEPAER
jgi:hypothetical protein